jgi:MFS family permease
MAGFALVPSLLPRLTQQWSLSATQGGWLSGIFFLGYIVAVPVLVSLTDRLDARRVYLACAALSGLAMAGFASFATSFAAALCWWWLAGLALAGTYMPGLKALTDRLPVATQSRGTAFYTATFGVGAGLSYLWIECVKDLVPWPLLFAIAAASAALSVLLVWRAVPPGKAPEPASVGRGDWRSDWRTVLCDRRILAFCGGYFGHNWELFGFRAWLVAYLTWMQATTPDPWTTMPGLIAALATFLAVPASILGNEGAHRWGRRRWLQSVMLSSCVMGLAIAWSSGQSSRLLVPLLLVYAASMNLDSAGADRRPADWHPGWNARHGARLILVDRLRRRLRRSAGFWRRARCLRSRQSHRLGGGLRDAGLRGWRSGAGQLAGSAPCPATTVRPEQTLRKLCRVQGEAS